MVPTQADFEHDLTARCREAVRATIQLVVDEELERLVGAGPYERNDQRVDVRNGAYPRRVLTTAGEVQLRVGRTRNGGPRPRRSAGMLAVAPKSTRPSRRRTSEACRRGTWPA
jgi:transposase-like protein